MSSYSKYQQLFHLTLALNDSQEGLMTYTKNLYATLVLSTLIGWQKYWCSQSQCFKQAGLKFMLQLWFIGSSLGHKVIAISS